MDPSDPSPVSDTPPPGPGSDRPTIWAGEDANPATAPSVAGEPAAASCPTPFSAAGPSAIAGPRLSKYEILEEIGRGGMGVVYRARDTELGREVALKTLPVDAARNPQLVERLLREARTAGALEHPGIVRIYDSGVQDGVPYFAMAFVRGRTFESALRDGGLPATRDRVDVVRRAAEAVAHAHERRIVHRDLKPSNVLIDAQGGVHVMDFGLAKRLDEGVRLTASGQMLGTPQYMPPEQIDGELESIGPASDVYALGAVLYEALTDRPPYEGSTLPEIVSKALARDPEPPRKRNPRVSLDLETICLRALAKEPGRRYATAAEFAADLRRTMAGEAIEARRASLWERSARWVRRRRVPTVLAAVAFVAAGVALALGFRSVRERQERERLEAEILGGLRQTVSAYREAALLARRAGASMAQVGDRFLTPLLAAAERAQGQFPGLAEPHYHVGRMYRALLRDDEAKAEQERALAKEPDYGPARYERGVLASRAYRSARDARRGELLLARAAGRGAHDPPPAMPTDAEVEEAFPEVARLRAEAKSDLERAAASPVPAVRARAAQALAAVLDGESGAKVIADLEQVLGEDPGLEEVVEARADLEAARGARLEAARWYEAGWRADRGWFPHLAALATHLLFAAQEEAAAGRDCEASLRRGATVVEEGLRFEPDNASLWQGLAQFRHRLAEIERGRGGDPGPGMAAALEAADRAIVLAHGRVDGRLVRARLLRERAEFLAARGRDPLPDLEESLAELGRVEALGAPSAGFLNQRAHLLLSLGGARSARGQDPQGEYRAALVDLERALERYPRFAAARATRASAWMRLADALRARGREATEEYRRAIAEAEQALELDAQSSTALSALAGAWVELGTARKERGENPDDEYARAVAAYERVLQLNPRNVEATSNRAYTIWYRGMGRVERGQDPTADYEEAVAGFEKALAIDPQDAGTAVNLANVWWSIGQYRRSRGGDPDEAYSRSAAAAEEARKINPRHAAAAGHLAVIHKARADLARARGGDPMDHYAAALAAADQARTLRPRDPGTENNRAIILKAIGDVKRSRGEDAAAEFAAARAGFMESLAINPTLVSPNLNLGNLCKEAGEFRRVRGEDASADFEAAASWYDRALALNPSQWMVQANRGQVLEALGRLDAAVEAYQTSLRLGGAAAEKQVRPLLDRAAAARGAGK